MVIELIAILAGLYFLSLLYFNKIYLKFIPDGRPPLICGYIPFVGIGLEYGVDPRAKVSELAKVYGDIFTIYVMGQFITIVTDPADIAKVYSTPKIFSFYAVGNELGNRAFGLPEVPSDAYNELISGIHNALQKKDLPIITERADVFIQEHFQQYKTKEWTEVNLFDWISNIITSVTLRSVYGESIDVPQISKTYFPFDDKFGIIASNIPQNVKEKAGLIKLRDEFSKNFVNRPKEDACSFLHDRFDIYSSVKNITPEQIGSTMSIVAWASLTNTIYATFWILFHLLQQPQEVQDEILQEIKENLDDSPDKSEFPTVPFEQLNSLTKVDALLNETLRLYHGVMSTRMCLQDYKFDSNSGRSYIIPKNSLMLLTGSNHDPHYFKEPNKFIWDRFLKMPNQVVTRNGKMTPLSSVFLPFGGGANLCPGRYFAKNEIKILFCVLLTSFDMRLETKDAPVVDRMKWTLQVGPIKEGEVKMSYKAKI